MKTGQNHQTYLQENLLILCFFILVMCGDVPRLFAEAKRAEEEGPKYAQQPHNQPHSRISNSARHQNQKQCAQVDILQCRQWYDRRQPHNIYTWTTSEYKTVKEIITKMDLVKQDHPECVRDATFLLCSLYSPVCIEGSRLEVLQPCRELCTGWKKKCYGLPVFRNVALPEKMGDCEVMPEFHNSMCIQPSTFFTKEQGNKLKKLDKESETDESQANQCSCQGFKQKQPKYRHFRKAGYAFEATITSREKLANGNTKIILDVQKIYKSGKTNLKLGKLRMWSSCLCQKDLHYGDKNILLVGESSHEKKKHLEINQFSFIVPYQKYKDRLLKWQSKCRKRKNCNVTLTD